MNGVVAVFGSTLTTVHRKVSERRTALNAADDDGLFLVFCAGNSMPPQIITDEVSFVLKGLANLLLHPLAAMHLSRRVRGSEVRPEQNQHEEELESSSSSTLQLVKLQPNLNSERAHLFLLYKNFCELLTTRYDHECLF